MRLKKISVSRYVNRKFLGQHGAKQVEDFFPFETDRFLNFHTFEALVKSVDTTFFNY